jgi:hypothetical protein
VLPLVQVIITRCFPPGQSRVAMQSYLQCYSAHCCLHTHAATTYVSLGALDPPSSCKGWQDAASRGCVESTLPHHLRQTPGQQPASDQWALG